MDVVTGLMRRIADKLLHLQEKAKPLFAIIALVLYAVSLISLMQETNPKEDLNGFMVEALVRLSLPFGIILLQETMELITLISGSMLRSTGQQFQIVALVLVRSFFKDFGKLNTEVVTGAFDEYTQKAVVKLLSIVLMTALMICFRKLSRNSTVKKYGEKGHKTNLYKEMSAILLVGFALINLIAIEKSFTIMVFISLIFTGMIIIDAVFFIVSIAGGHAFSKLMFEGGIVIGLVFARFALFANNTLAYMLSTLGIAFATASLFLFNWSQKERIPGEVDW